MKTVLIVDDCAVDRTMAGGIASKAGWEVVFAGNGEEALEVVDSAHPDVVLTDLQMPVVDGLQLVERIRQKNSGIPVMLMTAFGSEEIAANALQAGAASYVPKKNLAKDLQDSLSTVLSAVRTKRELQRAKEFLQRQEAYYRLGYESDGPSALVSHFQENLAQMNFGDEATLLQVGMAISEALANAVDHGNLELDSALREDDDDTYRSLGRQRATQLPYSERSVHVTEVLTPTEVRYTIRDEGHGFDPSSLPDPTNPENLLLASGRGVMLIRTFMDEVRFSEKGNEIRMSKRRKP